MSSGKHHADPLGALFEAVDALRASREQGSPFQGLARLAGSEVSKSHRKVRTTLRQVRT